MHRSLLDILVDPISKAALEIEAPEVSREGDVLEGVLRSGEEISYPIVNGIPRFVITDDSDQRQTERSFGYKWARRDSYETEEFKSFYHDWLRRKYGFSTDEEMAGFFRSKRRALEVGCGGGMSATVSLSGRSEKQEWVGVDISAAIDVAQSRLGHVPNTHFVQADILQLPFRQESFDLIFAEGVLHHTPSTERAIKSLAPLLTSDGEMMFYVYRKKGPIREFTDDYIRDLIADLEPEKAWELLKPLTKLGQALSELHVEVDVPEDIPYLGIKAGRQDVQRLIYWHFAKMYWNESVSFEMNNHVNFDWYHPRYAHRQTESDVRRWCDEAGLSISYLDEQESGFTVRAGKR